MIRNISQSRSAKWFRAITAATAPVVVIGILLSLLSQIEFSSFLIFLPSLILELPGIYLHTWLLGDPFARLLSPVEAAIISRQVIWLSLLFWFIFGFISTYFLEDKKYKLGAWLIVLLGCAIWAILFG